MALHFADLQALVKWLAVKHHAGAVYPMAAKTGLSSATMDKWVKGTVKNCSARCSRARACVSRWRRVPRISSNGAD